MINSFDLAISNDEKLSQLKKRLVYFNENKNDPVIIFNSQDGYKNIAFIAYLIQTELNVDVNQVIISQKAYVNLAKIIRYLCLIKSEINFKNARKPLEYIVEFYSDTNLDERHIFSLSNLNLIFNALFLVSNEVRRYFIYQTTDNGSYLSTLIDFISNTDFMHNFFEYDPLFDGFINLIWKLSYNDFECKLIWKNFNSIEKLSKFAALFPKWTFEVFSTIAFIATNNELNNLKDLQKIIDKFVELTMICFNESNIQIKKKYFYQDEKFVFSMPSILLKNGYRFTIDDLLESLYHLAVNPNLRQSIYSKFGFNETLKKILTNSNEIVQYFALRVLCQLAFDNELYNQLKKDDQLINIISNLKAKSKFEFKKLEKTCNKITWILMDDSRNVTQPQHAIDNQIIILAEATTSNQLILKLKSDLEAKNFQVFFNLNSNLETVAVQIEKSCCVVICINEKFNLSIECQIKAQYANRLNKKIVPIIVQSGYESLLESSWIGIIIRNRFVFDLTQSNENIINRLVEEINTKKIEVTEQVESIKLRSISIPNNNAQKWSNNQVKEWLEKNKISINLIGSLDKIDGAILFQLYELKKYTPEFFYKSVTKNSLNDCIEVAKFSDLLNKLFD